LDLSRLQVGLMLIFVVLIPLMSYPNPALMTLPDGFIAQTVTSTQPAPANMVVNPDFEVQLANGGQLGWSTYQKLNGAVLRTVSDAAIAHSGVRCVMINQTVKSQQNFASWFQDVPAQAGVTYRFAFWMKTENVKPSVACLACQSSGSAFGFVTFLDRQGVNIPSMGRYYQSPNVFMTHDWKRFEISFVTPDGTGYVRILLALANAIGTVFFDSVSLVPSSFMKLSSPAWLSEAVVYELGPWEFAQFGNGSAFRGIVSRLPELQALGVNTLYLLPIWADQGWYSVTDFFAIYKEYGTQDDFRTLVLEAHNHGMRVLLDFYGTIGVPPGATILQQHPDWLILNENNSAYYSWTWPECNDTCLRGIDTNRPDVQDYFVQVAKYYVQMFNIDGYRCDAAFASPYEMFEKIRAAIQAVKPDAVLIGEVSPDQPIYHETVFDATYDFGFLTFASSLPDSMSANRTASWLNGEIDSYPPGALTLRYLEDHDLNYTAASKYGPAGDRAFAAFIFTVNGVPMIYNGQEVGNVIAQPGPWMSLDWNANPQAAQFTSFYTKLIHIRLTYPALQRGATVPVNSTNGRVAAYARVLTGAAPVLVVINFSNSYVNTTLGTSLQALGLQATPLLVNALDNKEYPVIDIGSFNLSLQPYQEYILVPSTAIVRTETHTAAPTASQSSTTPILSSSTLQTSPGPGLAMSSFIEYFVVIVGLAAIAVGSILISRKRARMPTKAKESTSKMKAKKGVQFCINCGSKLQPESKFCDHCGPAQT
jgi:cyclomaltodextrinase